MTLDDYLNEVKTQYEQNPELQGMHTDVIRVYIDIILRNNINLFEGIFDTLDLPIVVSKKTEPVAYYTAELNKETEKLSKEYVVISSIFGGMFQPENSQKFKIHNSLAELMLVLKHELYHAKFRHIIKEQRLSKTFKIPSTVYNIAFDIFVNTLLKYDNILTSKFNSDIENSVVFEYGVHFISSKEKLAKKLKNAEIIAKKFGTTLDEKDMAFYNVLSKKDIESLDDNELVELMYLLFRDFFDEYEKLFNAALNKVDNKWSGNNTSVNTGVSNLEKSKTADNASSSSSKTEQQDKDTKQQDTEQLSSYINEVKEQLEEDIKQKIKEDKNFEKEFKKYISNFSNLPNVELDVVAEKSGLNNNEMSTEEKLKAFSGRSALRDIVEKILESSSDKGSVPGYLRSLADVKPKRPEYVDILRTFGKRHFGSTHRTYSPSNKKTSREVLLPSRISRSLDVAFVIDTSGSMADESLQVAISHIKSILKDVPSNSKLHVYFNDAKFQHVSIKGKNIKKLEELVKTGVQGGGGSVFTDVFKDKYIKKCSVLVFVSDFFIYPPKCGLNIPTVLLYTPKHDKGILDEFSHNFKPSVAIPLELSQAEKYGKQK